SLYWALRREGKFAEASQAMRGALPYWKPSEHMGSRINPLVRAYAEGGRKGFLRQSLAMHKLWRDGALYMARDYADLGDKEQAFRELQVAFRQHDIVLWILCDPEFDPLRPDPRFQRLIQAIHFGMKQQQS